jgi:hypothetical protein
LFSRFRLLNPFFKRHAKYGGSIWVAATLEGWSRLDAQQREKFFQVGLRAALRLDRLQFRAWLLRRLKDRPLAEPFDPGNLMFGDVDIALFLRAAGKAPGEAGPETSMAKSRGVSHVGDRDGDHVTMSANITGE